MRIVAAGLGSLAIAAGLATAVALYTAGAAQPVGTTPTDEAIAVPGIDPGPEIDHA